jgi:hypothetical protein
MERLLSVSGLYRGSSRSYARAFRVAPCAALVDTTKGERRFEGHRGMENIVFVACAEAVEGEKGRGDAGAPPRGGYTHLGWAPGGVSRRSRAPSARQL